MEKEDLSGFVDNGQDLIICAQICHQAIYEKVMNFNLIVAVFAYLLIRLLLL